jgi:hypothetical protein
MSVHATSFSLHPQRRDAISAFVSIIAQLGAGWRMLSMLRKRLDARGAAGRALGGSGWRSSGPRRWSIRRCSCRRRMLRRCSAILHRLLMLTPNGDSSRIAQNWEAVADCSCRSCSKGSERSSQKLEHWRVVKQHSSPSLRSCAREYQLHLRLRSLLS